MRVSVLKDKKMDNLILPEEVSGSYWITDIDKSGMNRNLISIESDNGKWKLVSNAEVFCMENNSPKSSLIITPNNFYVIHNVIEKETYIIYCSSINTNYSYYEIENSLVSGINIGSLDTNQIVHKYVEQNCAVIKSENGEIILVDNNSKQGMYVNGAKVIKRKKMNIGDTIFIFGLKMILIGENVNNKMTYYLGIMSVLDYNPIGLEVKLQKNVLNAVINDHFVEKDNDFELAMYEEKDYFHKVPRFVYKIETAVVNIDPPPEKVEEPGGNALLTVGPMITMSLSSMTTGVVAISNLSSGNSSLISALPSIIMCVGMLAGVLVWPTLNRKFTKKRIKENEAKRQEKYGQYIESIKADIEKIRKEQTSILQNNYLDTKQSEETILKRHTTLWQRRAEDSDFLEINLGIGTFPMKIDLKYPEKHFTMAEDNLKQMVESLGNEPKNLNQVPVIMSLKDNFISGIIGDYFNISEFTKRMLIQILALHSYDDLKVVILTNEENEFQWNFIKTVPHLFTDDRSLRFFGVSNEEYKEIFYHLDRVYQNKTSKDGKNKSSNYLIITDNFKKIRDFDVIKNILDEDINIGFELLILDKALTGLPDRCKVFMELDNEHGILHFFDNMNKEIKYSYDMVTSINFNECALSLSNIPIDISIEGEGSLPDKVTFLEMFDVGKVEQLNIPFRWENSNPIMNLNVPVGLGKNGDKIGIDLHEKYHGPHGLIAGMTGSGKSEFIISYILSAAINYHPDEFQFILIDYKGGGLAGAFENKLTGLKLPHLVGTITNLDANEINRSLASIESELKRRQALFNKAREVSGDSTIDIYKYQKLYREKVIDEPVSHLFIISDEFAELKSQQPEFMAQLISTARIGRSLGVHLILATQKPSGVVDPQIWSNTRFRVCMRVQDPSDSNEVIKCPDAAFLKKTGRFYFQVGQNEIFLLGQAAWAGNKYRPSEKMKKTVDTSINFIDNIGKVYKIVDTKEKKEEVIVEAKGEELLNILTELSNVAKERNINCRPLWLENIPSDIRVENLIIKYKYSKKLGFIETIIGEYDLPAQQEQRLLTLSLTDEGNCAVYGASGSGKENFIITTIYSAMQLYSASEINFYILDFGSEVLKMFNKCPLVGNVLGTDNGDEVINLFKMIEDTIEERKQLFADYNGDFSTYVKNSGKVIPAMVIVINNFEIFNETFNNLEERVGIVTRDCTKYGIYFIVTVNTPNGIRYKLAQNFSSIYALQQNREDDFSSILGNVKKKYPAKIYGRGIFKGSEIYEFQTALATDVDDIPVFIKEKCDILSKNTEVFARKIPKLPDVIGYDDIVNSLSSNGDLVIGIEKDSLNISKFEFMKNYVSLISSQDLELLKPFCEVLVEQVKVINNSRVIFINGTMDDFSDELVAGTNYIKNQYNEYLEQLLGLFTSVKQQYDSCNMNKELISKLPKITVFIYGLDGFISKITDKVKIDNMFNIVSNLELVDFIILDTIDKIKKYEFELWFKTYVNASNAIWVGSGISNQYTIQVQKLIPEMKMDIGYNYGFVIKNGKIGYIKLLENMKKM